MLRGTIATSFLQLGFRPSQLYNSSGPQPLLSPYPREDVEVTSSVRWRHLPGRIAQAGGGVIAIGVSAPSELRLSRSCPLVVRPRGCSGFPLVT